VCWVYKVFKAIPFILLIEKYINMLCAIYESDKMKMKRITCRNCKQESLLDERGNCNNCVRDGASERDKAMDRTQKEIENTFERWKK